MEKQECLEATVCREIGARTGGEILIGVVGPDVLDEHIGVVLIRHFDRQTLYTRLVDEMIPKETASEKAAADGWRGKVKSLLNRMNQKEEDEQQ